MSIQADALFGKLKDACGPTCLSCIGMRSADIIFLQLNLAINEAITTAQSYAYS